MERGATMKWLPWVLLGAVILIGLALWWLSNLTMM